MGRLYIVATPIGNLKDITLRALEVLKNVDFVLAEDTRITKKLLSHFDIKKPVLAYHQHSGSGRINEIKNLLSRGKDLALVSDSGTPGISDPGNKLISQIQGVEVIPVPGPCALAAAGSVSGFAMDRFLFLGFLPVKNKRSKFLAKIKESEYPVVFYESPHRILKTLDELKDCEMVVCRELTKKFETIYRGSAQKIASELKEHPIKGEFVVISKKQ